MKVFRISGRDAVSGVVYASTLGVASMKVFRISGRDRLARIVTGVSAGPQ